MKLPNLDYSALSSPQLTRRPLSAKAIIISLMASTGLGFVLFVFGSSLVAGLAALSVIAVPVFWGTWATWRLYEYDRLQRAALTKFAAANKITYQYRVRPQIPGFMFDVGSAREFETRLIIPTDGHPVELGNYRYTTGSGKNKTLHELGYLRLKLPRKLPHMVLDAKANNFMGRFSNLPSQFDKSQVLELEGDFNNYFTLYAPRQYERDALYVLTPDVMQILIDAAGDYDVEIVDDNLFMYSSRLFALANPATLQGLLTIASRLSPEFESQTDRYADERIANFNANVVAEPGRRLKQRFQWVVLALIVAIVVATIADDFTPANLQFELYVIFATVFWILIIWIYVRRFRGMR